jgi:hypothetical protein
VEFDRVVPPSGNMWAAGRQFWLGPARAGTVIRFWADTQLIHLSAGGARIKTLRSHLSVADLAKLAADGAVPARPAPLPPAEDGQAIEVERPVSRGGLVCLGPHRLLAAEILGGQLVGIRIEPNTLMFYDPHTRVLLRTRPLRAGRGLMGHLAAQTMAGCRVMWPDTCRRWLPVWLPLELEDLISLSVEPSTRSRASADERTTLAVASVTR